jgi:hypothetical protein
MAALFFIEKNEDLIWQKSKMQGQGRSPWPQPNWRMGGAAAIL